MNKLSLIHQVPLNILILRCTLFSFPHSTPDPQGTLRCSFYIYYQPRVGEVLVLTPPRVVTPGLEGLEYSQKPVVVRVIVEFCNRHGAYTEDYRADFAVIGSKGEYPSDRIIGRVGLDHQRESGVEMVKHRGRGKGLFEGVESLVAGRSPVPRSDLARQARERDYNL